MFQTEIGIPRHSAGPRQVARAGEIWRLFQELAIQASTAVGWPPDRYIDEGSAFVIYGMTVRHHREVRYGQQLSARTWVHDFKRATLTKRQIRLVDDGGPVAACTQQWVHVDAHLKPSRASQSLMDALPVEHPDEPSVTMPETTDVFEGRTHRFAFRPWHIAMDPLGHVNHPGYVDFCDEGISRALAEGGVDPHLLVPLAEQVTFKAGAVAMERVEVQTRVIGRAAEGTVLRHELHSHGGERIVATATTVRRLADGSDLADWLG